MSFKYNKNDAKIFRNIQKKIQIFTLLYLGWKILSEILLDFI